jgi:alkylated DNA repair dioxygenase AlkB
MNANPPAGVRKPDQPDLFDAALRSPEGFRYQPDLITARQEVDLAESLSALPFEPFDFHGYLAHRQVVGFGWRYDYSNRQVRPAPPIPAFLAPLREAVAAFAGQPAAAFEQVLINAYRPGAGIGWHRDKPHFETVLAVSLLAPCTLRFRRRDGPGWRRETVRIAPRSAYLLSGASRHGWEHSIPPLEQFRYSITFRTLAEPARAGTADDREP